MDWQSRLDAEMAMHEKAKVNIDGQIWKASKLRDGQYTLVTEYGRSDTFRSLDQLKTAIQSWTENPRIMIESDVQ